jgi:NADH:ubiquinone oxidoreductase subunit E
MLDNKVGAALVVGGGIAGMQASLDLAESGIKVYLVDKNPAIGGAMAQLDKTFPTNDCAMCTLAPRMVDCGRHINIEKLTYSEVVGIQGEPGRFHAQIRKKARSVELDKCTGCEECAQNCLVRYRVYPPPEEVAGPEMAPEDRPRVDSIISHHRDEAAPLIGVLQDINEEFNYLPAPVLHHVSRHLGIPLAHILKVSTFYSLFSLKPRGKHVISVCQGTTCFVRGVDRIMAELEDTLGVKPGEVTEDGKFSLETLRCIGCCALAPCIRVDQQVHTKIRPARVRDILVRYQNASS